MSQYLFYFLAFLSVFSAIMVVTAKSPIHSVLFLIVTFFAIAGEYVLMNAQFLAVVNVIVYAGAIMVLFLFVIMLLNLNKETEPQKSNLIKIAGVASAGLMLLVLVAALRQTGANIPVELQNQELGLVKNLGRVLFGEFLLPFEFASILLLSAMVGSVLLAQKENN